jgi:CBS domain-containing membrane protein
MQRALLTLLRGAYPIKAADALRASVGALLALAAIAGVMRLVLGDHASLAWIVPAVGSSAVLVFALPASPLAQPRAVIGGNIVSGLVGLACAILIPSHLAAAPVAVAAAILLMSVLGCLHPPGGAVALGAALSATATSSGLIYLAPIAVCSVMLVLGAAGYLNLTGRSYPHRAAAKALGVDGQSTRAGYSLADLDRALSKYGELLDVSREDLDALFRQVEVEAHNRLQAQIRCQDIMSRDVLTVTSEQSAASALAFLRQHGLRIAPVVDQQHRVVGMVRRAELLAAGDKLVEAALDPFAHKVRPGTAIESLLPLLSTGESHEVMVVDEDRRLVGMVTQTDLLAVLYRAHIVEGVVATTPKSANGLGHSGAGGEVKSWPV